MNINTVTDRNVNWVLNETYDDLLNVSRFAVEYSVLAVLIGLLAVIGFAGNIPILVVYVQRKDKKASNTFIKALAFLDLLVCTCVMPYTILYEYHIVTSDVACRLFELLRHFAVMASNVTLVAIASERYIAVCKIDTRLNVSTLNKGVVAIFVFAVLTAIPATGIFAVVTAEDVSDVPCSFPHSETSGPFCHFTYTILGKPLVTAYQLGQMGIFVLTLLVIATMYTIIYIVLWRKTKKRKRITLQRHKSDATNSVKHRISIGMMCSPDIVCDDSLRKEPLNDDISPQETEDLHCHSILTENKRISEGYPCIGETNSDRRLSDCKLSYTDEKNFTFGNEEEAMQTQGPAHTHSSPLLVRCSADKPDSHYTKVTFKKVSEERKPKPSVVSNCIDSVRLAQVSSDVRSQKRRYCHRRTAKMLFLCTVIYFFTWIPFWLDIFGFTNSRILRYCFFIGNATNPLVYGIVNKRVRAALKELFRACLALFRQKEVTQESVWFGSTSHPSGTMH